MKTLNIFAFLLFFHPVVAQNNLGKADDLGRISLVSYVPDQIEGINPIVESTLHNKLNQIVTKNGLGGASIDNRFIITANVVVTNKDITPTAPPLHSFSLEITIYIGDGIDGLLFASTSVPLKGVGESEAKAYMSALKSLKVDDPNFQAFIEKGKNKIIAYYNSRCDFILKEAQMLSSRNEFDAAISKLVGIPEVCKECFDKAMEMVPPIYQSQIDRQCKLDLAEAKNIWNSSQNQYGAEQASTFLSKIEPRSICYKEAMSFSETIGKRILELDKREWNFKLKVQQDEVDIRKATIKAARDIGVAYGNNQPNVTYNIRTWW